jgi:hypothetical protein
MKGSDNLKAYYHRLGAMRGQDIHRQNASRNISKMTREYNWMSNRMAKSMSQQDAPMSARLQANRDMVGQWSEQVSNIYGDADLQDVARRDDLNREMAQVQLQIDEQKRMEKEEEKAKKNAMITTGVQVAGTIAGTVLSGGNPMIGSMIGSGLGKIVGGALQKDAEMAISGVGDAVTGYVMKQNIKSENAKVAAMRKEFAEGLELYTHMDNPEWLEYDKLKSARNTDILNKFNEHISSPEYIDELQMRRDEHEQIGWGIHNPGEFKRLSPTMKSNATFDDMKAHGEALLKFEIDKLEHNRQLDAYNKHMAEYPRDMMASEFYENIYSQSDDYEKIETPTGPRRKLNPDIPPFVMLQIEWQKMMLGFQEQQEHRWRIPFRGNKKGKKNEKKESARS